MNDDTLNYANRIRSEMGVVEKMLNRIEKKEAVVDITFNNGDTQRVVSDLTEAIRDFNNGTKPVKLTGNLLLPVEAGVTGATITGWNEVESGNGDAN